jgi:hypothetical protein
MLFLFLPPPDVTLNGTAWELGDFVLKIRAELPASVEKSGSSSSRTNVVFKLAAAGMLRMRAIIVPRENIALHTWTETVAQGCAIAPQSGFSVA